MLQDLLKDHKLYHSEFQQDYFITGRSGGTQYGQYMQALRELYKRVRGLREAYCDREKLQLEIEEKAEESNSEDRFKKGYAEIEYKRKSMQMEEIERSIHDTEVEFKRFYQQAVFLKEKIGELTDEKRRELDYDMWVYKVKEAAAIDFITVGRLSANTYELITSFPWKERIELIKKFRGENEIKQLIQWYETRDEGFEIEDKPLDVQKCISEI